MITAVSSIDSVVWVTKATCVGSRMSSRATSSTVSTRWMPPRPLAFLAAVLTHRAFDLGVAAVPDQDHLVALAAVARHLEVHLG